MATETYVAVGTRNQTIFSRISDQINFPEQIVDQAKTLWENWRFPGNKYKWTETQRQAQNKGKQTPFLQQVHSKYICIYSSSEIFGQTGGYSEQT